MEHKWLAELKNEIENLSGAQEQVNACSQEFNQLSSRLDVLDQQSAAWLGDSAPRLEEVELALKDETYAPEARAELAEIDSELKEIGYDAAAHDHVRQKELDGRKSQGEKRDPRYRRSRSGAARW